jgi:hypothetical protein
MTLRLVRRSKKKKANKVNYDAAEEPPEYQAAPEPNQKPPAGRMQLSRQQSGGGTITPPTSAQPPSTPPDATPPTHGLVDPRTPLHKFHALDMAKAAYANDPRRLGAFARLKQLAGQYNGALRRSQALQRAAERAIATTTGRRVGLALRQQLEAAGAELDMLRKHRSDLDGFVRDVRRRLTGTRRQSASRAAATAAEMERIMAALGAPEELEAIGRGVLTDAGAPRPPAGAEALAPDVAWAEAVDVLARDALGQERKTGYSWLPGEGLESVSLFFPMTVMVPALTFRRRMWIATCLFYALFWLMLQDEER